MSNPFQNMTTQGLEEAQDRLGGYQPLESGIYEMQIKALYAGQSQGGARSVTLLATVPGGQEYRETFYVTNKKGENWFTPQGSTKKAPLPGFTVVNDLCLIATGKELHEVEVEDKVINVYNWDEKREEPTKVPMIVEAIGQKIAAGVIRRIENKREKQGDEYVPLAETRTVNLIDKVFHPELRVTCSEARKAAAEGKDPVPGFWDAWSEKNTGHDQDKTDKSLVAGGATPPKPGKPAPAAGAAPKKSLFGNK